MFEAYMRGSLYPRPLLVDLYGKSGPGFHRSRERRDQFKISMRTPVENPLMTIESFNRQFQIGEKEREAVKLGWEQEMDNIMFYLVNSYTRAAQFEGLSAEASYRLQKVEGMVLKMVK
jgi:hypothetical protein